MKKEEIIRELKKRTITSMERMRELCEEITKWEYTAKIVDDHIQLYTSGGAHSYWITRKEATWVSGKPKGFKSISDKYLKRMYANGVYNKIAGVNVATMQMDKIWDGNVADEAHRADMYIGSNLNISE